MTSPAHPLDGQIGEQRGVAGRPHQAADAAPRGQQRAGDVGADEAGRAGDERRPCGHQRLAMLDGAAPGGQQIIDQDVAPGRRVGQRPGAGLLPHRGQPGRVAHDLRQRLRPRLRRPVARDQPGLAVDHEPFAPAARRHHQRQARGGRFEHGVRQLLDDGGLRADVGRRVGAGQRLGIEHARAARAVGEQRQHGVAIGALPRAQQVKVRAPVDERAHRVRQHRHVLDRVEAAHRDDDPALRGNPEGRRQPGAIAPLRAEEPPVDPPAQEADPLRPEQARQPRPIVGPRGEDERAAAVVSVQQALHARLGGAGHVVAIEEPRQRGRSPPAARRWRR